MNVMFLSFVMIAFSIFKSLIFASAGIDTFAPEFITPDVDVEELQECGDFFDCATDFIILMYQLVVAIFVILYDIILLATFLFSIMFVTIPDAPWFVNLLVTLPFLIGIAMVVAALFRGGAST